MIEYLNTRPNLGIPGERYRHAYMPGDDFYQMLLEGHRGLADDQSELMNARLVLLLANHIGALDVLKQALRAARDSARPPSESEAT